MTKKIEDVIARREDLSIFLVHLVSGSNAKDSLLSIINSGQLEARHAWGIIRENDRRYSQLPDDIKCKQNCVCFTETPLEYVWSLTEDIEGREHLLSNYGVCY